MLYHRDGCRLRPPPLKAPPGSWCLRHNLFPRHPHPQVAMRAKLATLDRSTFRRRSFPHLGYAASKRDFWSKFPPEETRSEPKKNEENYVEEEGFVIPPEPDAKWLLHVVVVVP